MEAQWIDRGDLWKNKVWSLKLQLRDRFRVAVDKHRRRQVLSDGYFPSTVQRWLHRLRDFRRESLNSSAAFYRKRVSKDFNAEEESIIIRALQALAVPVIGNACHVFMHGLNCVQVYGAEKLHEAILNRPKNKPLMTVSNHVASIDDPFLIASLLPPNILLDAHNLRWTLCASDRCFTNPVTSAFFRCVKVLPVDRGNGVYQKGMDMAISKLNSGGWVHIFPEGSRSRDGGRTIRSPKRGVGRLILDADNIPVVIPFVHNGMQEIMPIGAKFPRIGKTVTVLIGDPISFDDILNVEESQTISRGRLYDAVSTRIGNRLQDLKTQVDKLSLEHSLQSHNHQVNNSNRAAVILHQVDWESFGMASYINSEHGNNFPIQEINNLDKVEISRMEKGPCSDRGFKVGFGYEGGFVSRIRGFMNPTELMGFAARGLFMNHRGKDGYMGVGEVRPLKAWKHFFEANLLQQWNSSSC